MPGPSSSQIFNNVSNANLNQTQMLFVNDLEKSENVTNLYVSYYSKNATQYITQSSNLTLAISSNMTIDSYRLGNYNRSSITGVQAYTNAKNGDVVAKNVSTPSMSSTHRRSPAAWSRAPARTWYSALTAGIGALRGPKHGGANEVSFEIQNCYASPDEAEADIRKRVANREVVIGFGHAV